MTDEPIKRRCRNCERITLSRFDWHYNRIVSPNKIAHLADDTRSGFTRCGVSWDYDWGWYKWKVEGQ